MPSRFPDHRIEEVHTRLLTHYGAPPPRDLWDPLTQCIYSMLSPRAKTEVSHEVLRNLRATFGTWENLRDAPVFVIEDAIRAELLDDHHTLVKLHGQQTCTKNDPHCARCPLLDLCPTGAL